MKTAALLLAGAVFAVHLQAQVLDREMTAPPPVKVPATTHVMGERGANHRVWQRVTGGTNRLGTVEWSTNTAYVELASGLHYQDGRGVWQETKEEFELVPGWAVARKGPHKASIAQNLNTRGSVALEQPDGRMLRSQVVGLSYFDHGSGQSVLIAEIKDCAGTVLPPNQVIYEDAFTGVKADVRYTYTRAGLEQDIILRAQPPAPETFGLRSATTRLVVITEFFDTPTPGARVMDEGDPDEDVDLDFGSMRMGRGKAFELNATGGRGEREIPVRKEWRRQDGRDFLLEEVPVSAVRAELEKLPRQAAVRSKAMRTALARMELPAPRESRASDKPLMLAAAKMPTPGFVLDYVIIAENTGSFTFQADTTYYINGMLYLDGTTTIEGSTVIKHERSSALYCTGPVVCKTGPYQPAVLTAVDDDTVGEMISTSTHVPTDYYAYVALQCNQTTDLSYLCVRYADYGLISGGSLRHSQFINNYKDVYLGGGSLEIGNVLFQNSGWYAMGMYGSTVSAVNVTVHNVNRLWESLGGSSTLRLTNSLLIRLTNQCAAFTSFNTYSNGTDAGVFQTVGAGAHYLAPGSANRNVATTNINPTLLADLRKKTTYAPSVITNYTIYYNTTIGVVAARDTDPLDRGYHYDPVDYLVNACSMSNARLTVTNGAVVASYLDTAGLWLQGGGSIVAVGTPQVPVRFTYYNTAQEQPVFLSTQARSNFVYACMIDPYRTGGAAATGTFRFAQFTGLAGAGIPFRDQGANREFGSLSFHSCEFGPVYGSLTVWPTTSSPREFVNNLFWRTDFSLTPEGGAMCVLSNNLFWWSNPLLLRPLTGGTARVYNNAFERCVLNTGAPAITGILSNNYNGYLACGGTVPLAGSGSSNVTAALTAYQAGPLGRFYQPTNSALINKGSTLAGQAGLYHYTTATNQVKEAGTRVDIGYHYVAVNPATGTLPDTDSDGLPDYQDPNADGDALPDAWELMFFGDLSQTDTDDGDYDELTNLQEFQLGTSPIHWDTDGDELSDSEEPGLLVDVANPGLGYLDPLNPDTGNTGVPDGDKDSDHDAISNLGELRDWGSEPADAHTFTAAKDDGEYFFTATAGASPSISYAVVSAPSSAGPGKIRLTVDSSPNAKYDLFFRNNFVGPRWTWRRISTFTCDNAGHAVIVVTQPDPYMGEFQIFDANDTDGDGLSDGYEGWFTYNGKKSTSDVRDTDRDTLRDGWEVAYGLDPTDATGANGKTGNPDSDAYSNLTEYNNNATFAAPTYDPRKQINVEVPRPVVSISSSDANAGGPQGSAIFTITRTVGTGGTLNDPLTVYYSVGGQATYGADYSLTPAPAEWPRIFSATIAAGQASVTVTLSPVAIGLNGLEPRQVVVKLTPYAVSPVTQASDPLQWQYVVNLFKEAVTLKIHNVLPGLNGPVYAVKMYETLVYGAGNPPTCTEFHQLIVGGQFTMAGSTPVNNIARWNAATGLWEPLGSGMNGPVYAIEAVERFLGDTSPDIYVGGSFTMPAVAMARWSGASGTWSALGSGLNSQAYLQSSLCRVNALRKIGTDIWVGGRFSSAGGVASPHLAKWNMTASQWQGLGGTIMNCGGTTLAGYGLDSHTIMVTAIDRNGTAVGVSKNGVSCPWCPVSPMTDEAFYTVEGNGTVLRGQCRSANAAGVRAVLGNLAGTEQLIAPVWGSAYENFWGNYGGLGQVGGAGWELLGGGGQALPPVGSSPWWPVVSSFLSGWKPIGSVNSLVQYGVDVFVGGSFSTLSGAYASDPPEHVADYSPVNNLFRWNSGSGWSKLQNMSDIPCIAPGGLGVNGPVHAMDVEYSLCNGEFEGLWVGGNFTKAGGGSAWNIAFWRRVGNGNGYWDAPAAPTISSPASGAVFLPPAAVTITADFAATGCDLAGVEFFEGSARLAANFTAPYTFTWNGVSIGTHTITAIATDSNGKVGVSDAVSFRVDAPPVVSATSPTGGAVFTAPANITLSATASDSDGTVSKVEFYANGVLVGTDTSAPYSVTWSGIAAGNYTITAKATDNDGAATTSTALSITVQ